MATVLFQPRKLAIVDARNGGLSPAALRIHWPCGSLPTIRAAAWPSGLGLSLVLVGQGFFAAIWLSSFLPVRDRQPGPTPKLANEAFSNFGVSYSRFMVSE